MKKTAIFFLSILPLVLAFPALGFKPPELEKLKTTKVCLGCDLSSSSLQEAQLAGADLSGSNLSRSNLNGADLTGANLTGVNYQQTYFEGATWSNGETCKKGSFGKCVTETFERLLATKTCRDCSLPYAMLVDTYLQGAFLRGVDFNTNLEVANLTGANLAKANLTGAEITGIKIDQANLVDAIWINGEKCLAGSLGMCLTPSWSKLVTEKVCQDCILIMIKKPAQDFAGAKMSGSNLRNGSFPGTNFAGADLERTDFSETDLTASSFAGANLTKGKFNKVKFGATNFQGTNFEEVRVAEADAPGSNFTGASFKRALFLNSNLAEGRFVNLSLKGADFSDSNLNKSVFEAVDFGDVRLVGATWIDGQRCTNGSVGFCITDSVVRTINQKQCEKCSLVYAPLASRNLSGVKLGSAKLYRANLSGSNLSGGSLKKADLTQANLANADLSFTELEGGNFTGARWPDGNICAEGSIGKCLHPTLTQMWAEKKCKSCSLPFANLEGASLAWFNLNGSSLIGANLKGANLTGIFLENANLSKANLQNASLVSADLMGAKLENANLDGADLSGATWPDGQVCRPRSIGKCIFPVQEAQE